jgi:fatty-acyl-CoA synthase
MARQTIDPPPAASPAGSAGQAPAELSFEPLTPVKFLERSAFVFGDRVAVTDGLLSFTYRQLLERCGRLARTLARMGVAGGGRVAVLCPNSHVLLEAHYAVPMAGAILVPLNHRLSAEELTAIVEHSEASILIYDQQFRGPANHILARSHHPLTLVDAGGPDGGADSDYERLIARSEPLSVPVGDERSVISINYTSGTTGEPKGVMYHHRGAYLQALAMAYHARLEAGSTFLWTLPMFHCDGWCFTWAVTAAGGRHLCLRAFDPAEVWRLIAEEGVTHLNAAPTVLLALAHHPAAAPTPRPVQVCTGGAPPSPTLLARLAGLGIGVTHLYGLTESFGPVTICDWWPEWDALSPERQAQIKARQGVGNVISERMRLVDADGADVPADGTTIGEVALRGNNLMLGYYKDPAASERAAPDGWFRTGDLGVMHPDGYVELKDRSKDIIISSGENIPSIEVEAAVVAHPAVLEAAVVSAPDEQRGEVPVAYVTLKDGCQATSAEIIDFVRGRLAHFKAPRRVVFGPLPKTSTGKIQKYLLREREWAGRTRRIN